MIYNNLEFHNVDHLESVKGMSGVRLHRFPEKIRQKLGTPENHNGRFRAERTHGCEIRFVTEANYFDIALTAVEADIDIVIYRGDMMHAKHTLKAGICTVIHAEYPEIYKLSDTAKLPKGRFSPEVWRVQFGMNGYVYFHYLDTFGYEHRPPFAEEKPSYTWAAYGSSITCGSVTTLYSNSYIEQAAVRLGVDVRNLGLSGSCLCEKFAADYLSQLPVDILSTEIGVNMVVPFEEEEYAKRVEYLLKTIRAESPARWIFVIDMFPNKGLVLESPADPYVRHYARYKEIIREIIKKLEDERMILIHGEDVLKDMTYLSTDLLHPSNQGHIFMGENLAAIMRPYIRVP